MGRNGAGAVVAVAIGRILRLGRFPVLVSAGLALAGCSLLFGGKKLPVEQCADLMVAAFPDGDIEITHKSAVNSSITTVIVTIEGARTDVAPTAAVAHDVAVECKFDHDVLTDFHWTKAPFH
jgi:hypothetical protein